jgi:hypothetical protein
MMLVLIATIRDIANLQQSNFWSFAECCLSGLSLVANSQCEQA